MLRVVLAVVLAAALLSVTLPAVETASRDTANARLAAGAERVTAAAADLHEREDVVRDGPGARRVVTVLVPAESWWSARVDYVAVGGRPTADGADRTAVAWRVRGSSERTRRVPGVRVVGDGAAADGSAPLVLESPGRHRLVLELTVRDGRRTVVVRRLD